MLGHALEHLRAIISPIPLYSPAYTRVPSPSRAVPHSLVLALLPFTSLIKHTLVPLFGGGADTGTVRIPVDLAATVPFTVVTTVVVVVTDEDGSLNAYSPSPQPRRARHRSTRHCLPDCVSRGMQVPCNTRYTTMPTWAWAFVPNVRQPLRQRVCVDGCLIAQSGRHTVPPTVKLPSSWWWCVP